jgi:excisionase family DNA binding protein
MSKAESNMPADITCPDLLVPHAYRISDVCKLTGLGRTSVYAAIKSGELTARRWRRRTVVLAADLQAFLNNLPKSN